MIANSFINNLSLKDCALIRILKFMGLKISQGKLFRHIKVCVKECFNDVFMVGCCLSVVLLLFGLG